ncbi:MAG: TonB-dependent receptor [Bacteroidales bacterium]|nr:TonB-dependent receptor [Bacteroidales bacterium]
MRSNFIKTIFVCILTAVSAVSLSAQTAKVSGTVTDDKGEPVIGATVLVVGTMNGTQTDLDGKWELNVGDPQTAVIQFSCIGYESLEESVGNRAIIDVIIAENTESLDEVVLVGYGTQKKVNLTGSVSSVNFSEIAENRTIISASAALAGLAPGMSVQQTSSQPGSESTTIRIRGTGSFTSSASAPLVLVDGIEWSLDNVNPSDIESISILKDAASTAIYGTRAANGVILVTTKGGVAEKPRISYSYNAVLQTPYNNLNWIGDFADYMEVMNESYENSGADHVFSQTTIDLWREKKKDPNGLNEYGMPNYMAYPNTDWFTAIFNNGFSQEHNISISGGSKVVRYMVSGSYLDNEGIMTRHNLNTGAQKATFRTNIEADVTKWFTLGTKFYGQLVQTGTAAVSTLFGYLYQTSPGIWPGEDNMWGTPASSEDLPNSNNLFYQASGTGGKNQEWRLNGTLYAKIRPYKGVSIEGSFNYAPTFELDHTYSTPNGRWDYVTNTRYTESSLSNATVTDYTGRNYRASVDLLARYDAVFKRDHSFSALVGYSTQTYLTWAYQVKKMGATDWSLNDGSTYSDLYSAGYSSRSGYGLRSYFARVNYGYKDRYLFEANVRVDGSSVFGSDTRYGVFPSFSAGWRISEEPWMESSRRWLNQLKLRASWGETGNNQGIGNYTWQATYTAGNVVVDGSNATSLYIASMSNVNLKWETTSTLDIGIDAGFFNNRLTADIDYYYKGTRDILYTPSTYMTMGNFSQVPSNLGNLWNQGVEIALNWKDTAGKDFYYYAGVNFSFNKNRVTNFKGTLDYGYDENGDFYTNFSNVAEGWGTAGYLIEGHAIGEHYIYHLYNGTGAGYSGGAVDINAGPKDGMIRTESDMEWVRAMIDAGYTFGGSSTISKTALWYGDFIYADLNGDGNYGNSYDRYFTGHSSSPSYNLGVNLGFSWKGLEFSMIWSGAFDYYLNWTTEFYNTSTAQRGSAISQRIADDHYFYDPENPTDSRTNLNGKYPRFTNWIKNNSQSDFYEYKADYFKLKNVTIAYTLPQNWTKKFYVQALKFYVSGENLATITSYPGMDPEIGTSIGYPLMRQYTLGAQITF